MSAITVSQIREILFSPIVFTFLAGLTTVGFIPNAPRIMKPWFRSATARYLTLFVIVWIATGREYPMEAALVTVAFAILSKF